MLSIPRIVKAFFSRVGEGQHEREEGINEEGTKKYEMMVASGRYV